MIEKINQLKTTVDSKEVKALCENALATISSTIYNGVTADAKEEIERVAITELFDRLKRHKNVKGVSEWLSTNKRLFTIKNLGVREAINKLNETKELRATLETFKDALNEGVHEARLYEQFITALSPFGYFPTVGNAIQSIKDRVDKYKTDVDIVKILETMKETRSNYLVPLIEDVVNNYLSNKNKQTKHQLTETLMKFTYDPFVRDIVNILTLDATELQLEYANAQCDIEKVYSPVLYLGENESVFSVNKAYYAKKGNNINRLSEVEVMRLDPEFKALCETLANPNVIIEKDGITVYYDKDKAIITESGVEVNGKNVTNEEFNSMASVAEWSGNRAFYQMVEFIRKNFHEIAEVDFVKRVYLKENAHHAADVFKLRDNVFITLHDPALGKSTFYRNVNPIQAKNLMMEHLRFDVSSLFKGLLPDEEKIVAQINETKDEYNQYIKELQERIEEFKANPYSPEMNEAVVEALEEELAEVKAEFKDYLNNVERYLRAEINENITIDININGKKYTVPVPVDVINDDDEEEGDDAGTEVGTEYVADAPASAITFDDEESELLGDTHSIDLGAEEVEKEAEEAEKEAKEEKEEEEQDAEENDIKIEDEKDQDEDDEEELKVDDEKEKEEKHKKKEKKKLESSESGLMKESGGKKKKKKVYLKKITESINEHHKNTKKAQIEFICKHDKKCKKEDLEKLSAKEVKKKYIALEKKMGLYEHHKHTKKAQIEFICKYDKKCKKEDLEKMSSSEVKKKYDALEKKLKMVNESLKKNPNASVLNEAQIGDTVTLNGEKGYVIGQTYGGDLIVQVQGSTHSVKPGNVNVKTARVETLKPPFKFDKLTLQNLTTKALFEQYVKCGIFMGTVPIKTNNCFTKFSDWSNASDESTVNVLVEGTVTMLPKSQVKILEDINRFANIENYVEGVEIDEFTGEAVSNVMINVIDYTEAIGDADPVRIIRSDGVTEPTIDTVPKATLRTLSV